MNAEDLKKTAGTFEEQYRKEPQSAIVTLRAQGRIGENISCKVETGRAFIEAGLHPATGGTGLLACSGDLLLEALVACAGVTLNAVATAIGAEIKDATIKAEGDIDFTGTLGSIKRDGCRIKEIRLQINLNSDLPEDKKGITAQVDGTILRRISDIGSSNTGENN